MCQVIFYAKAVIDAAGNPFIVLYEAGELNSPTAVMTRSELMHLIVELETAEESAKSLEKFNREWRLKEAKS